MDRTLSEGTKPVGAQARRRRQIPRDYDFHSGSGDNGNVFGITNYKDNSRNQSFTYDPLNRLTSAQNAGTNCSATTVNGKTEYWGNTYGYDAWGNLLAKSVTKCSAESLNVTADANNHLQGGYTYDAARNMLHDATSGWNYSYDQENRITGAAGYTYTYDGDGNRVEKSNGSTGTLYWYMSPGIVAESDLSGNLKSEYVFFDGERVARKDFPGLAVSYYFSDHLKTTDIVTDASGNIKNESDFYPWGGELEFLANDSNHYKFTGKERDTETGLDYFGARYYSNGLGRFITPDWAAKATAVPYAEFADPQSLNLYSYVRNIPTVKADPDGHCDWCRDAWDFGTGVVQGIVASASMGAVGSPKTSDSNSSLAGQALGTAIEGGVSTDLALQGAATAGAGLLGEVPTAGGSTVLVVAGTAAALVGGAGALGAGKNAGAILNAMANKKGTSGSKESGSYTNTHASGRTYNGKGGRGRSQASGKRVEKQTGDKHTATDWTPSPNDREGFKDESRRIDANGGASSDSNHNKIESPGKNYRKQDGSN